MINATVILYGEKGKPYKNKILYKDAEGLEPTSKIHWTQQITVPQQILRKAT